MRHYVEFCGTLGCLDNFSAFKYESYLAQLRRRPKHTNNTLSHVVHQILLLREISVPATFSVVTTKAPNNCVLTDNGIVLVKVLNGSSVEGRYCRFVENLYSIPYESCQVKIGYYEITETLVSGKIIRKCILIQQNGKCVIIPLCSTFKDN